MKWRTTKMEDRIRRHVEDLFAETAPTRKAVELKEEMIQNLTDKYSDLVAEGKTEEAACNIAIAGIGDISALLAELEAEFIPDSPEMYISEEARTRSAMLTAVAVMMYILCALPLIFLALIGVRFSVIIGVPIMFIMAAGATALLFSTI